MNSVAKCKVFMRYEDLVCGVLLPVDINFSSLVRYIKKKFKVNDVNGITLTYNIASTTTNILDDDDLDFFKSMVDGSQSEVQTICINQVKEPVVVTQSSCSPHLHVDLNDTLLPEQDANTWQRNNLTHIPPTPQPPPIDSRLESKDRGVMKVNDRFDDKAECIYEVSLKCLKEGYEFYVHKSCTIRYAVKCVQPKCDWHINCRRIPNCIQFRITAINDCHTCSKIQFNPNHRNATAKTLSKLLRPKITDVTRVYKPRDIIHDLNMELNIDVSYTKAWRGKQLAVESTQGCPKASFAQLPYYCHNLKLANEGTVTHIETDYQRRFKNLFISFGAAIKSFLCYMQPLIIIDATHLKGPYVGTNLVAVGMDGNNQIIPIATGVSQGESGESWTWFLTNLKESIGEVPNLEIISDRQHAIALACKDVFPNAFHGYCCRPISC